MSIHYGQFCPIAKASEVLGERWTILIIRELLLGSTRFNELQRALALLSPSLLSKRLAQLQDYGLVIRKEARGQARAEYFLTAAGKELQPVIMSLGEWGARWARGQMDEDDLDVELLMIEFKRRLDVDALPGGRTVMRFTFQGLEVYPHWWLIINDDGTRELCVDNPREDVDITLASDLRSMTEIWAGDLSLREAKKTGRLKLSGNPILVRTISQWLGIGLLAHMRPAKSATAR